MQSKAYEFDAIANGPFLPIYPVIAQQIIQKTGIYTGVCIDIGSGGGHLGINIAQITDMNVILLDKSEDALSIAVKRANDWGLGHRTSTVLADVQSMPLDDGIADLCISRGSVWFWEDQKKGFEEIYRVLAEGGLAYIGGGFGTKALKEAVDKKMKVIDSDWPESREKFVAGNNVQHFTKLMDQIGITNFEVTDDEKGIWVVFKKERAKR